MYWNFDSLKLSRENKQGVQRTFVLYLCIKCTKYFFEGEKIVLIRWNYSLKQLIILHTWFAGLL